MTSFIMKGTLEKCRESWELSKNTENLHPYMKQKHTENCLINMTSLLYIKFTLKNYIDPPEFFLSEGYDRLEQLKT